MLPVFLPMLLSAAQIGQAAPPLPAADPASWITEDDYPAVAQLEGREGRVQVALAIDAKGGVTGCKVIVGSGVESLDLATCRLLQERARFVPARDASGHAVPGTAALPVLWALAAAGPEEPIKAQLMRAHITIAAGRITGCSSSTLGESDPMEQSKDDCGSLGSAESLGKLFGDDLRRARAIDVTVAMLLGDGSFVPNAPAGPRRVILAESVFKVGPDRKIASCTARTTYKLDEGKLLDLCSAIAADAVIDGDASAFVVRMDATIIF